MSSNPPPRLIASLRWLAHEVRRGKHDDARERSAQELARLRMLIACPIAGFYQQLRVKHRDLRAIPVIINNYNRYECLVQLVAWLEKVGMTNIHILDNDSSYPPLLEYYARTPYRVVRLGRNVGYKALWTTPVWNEFKNDYYIYTDPDVLPWEQCPDDFIEHFFRTLNAQPAYGKVGFGLKIDDLPDHYAHKAKVVTWEQKFWQQEIAPGLYDAKVDTTFALYRPRAEGGHWCTAIRTGPPYVARHLPWYADSAHPNEEDEFYARSVARATHWTAAR
jgi:hypothetical protein